MEDRAGVEKGEGGRVTGCALVNPPRSIEKRGIEREREREETRDRQTHKSMVNRGMKEAIGSRWYSCGSHVF